MKAVHVRISGIVQGVGYRAWTEGEALSRGLDGWVRNRRDSTVEAVLSGKDADIDDLLSALWTGPSHSRVDAVEVTPETEPVQPGFHVRSTS